MNNLKILFLTLIFSTCFVRVNAQSNTTYPPEQLKAAGRLLQAQDIGNTMQKTFATVIQAQAQQIPEGKRSAFIDVMNKFFAKYMTSDAVIQGLIPIYASEYSTDELNKITDFLLTPAGKAMTARQTDLLGKSMKWGQDAVAAHQDELQTMIQDALKDQ